MLIKTTRHNGSIMYFDSTRVLYVVERGDCSAGEWSGPSETVAKVLLDSEQGAYGIYFRPEAWAIVRTLLGIDTAVQVEATNPL